ncbi:MAG TPA: uroporphyrinogen decarboxylase family protein [bacterium]|nr:uroporphyrinogen decarboxylase family protein [bacterium]HNT66095.1 uroporphyrinogen decarboxylase family protein [bacterium]
MTSKQRMIAALDRRVPDRLPVTTHHIMQYFLDTYMNGIGTQDFFDYFGLDPITWTVPHMARPGSGESIDPRQGKPGFLESERIISDHWRIDSHPIPDQEYTTIRHDFVTPKKVLSMVTQCNEQTTWVFEHLIKEKSDIDVIAECAPTPVCNVAAVNGVADAYGERGLVRGHIPGFEVFGQPGCWQDACCLFGTEAMIMQTLDDPEWVHAFLAVLQRRKIAFARSLAGARYDLLELGGGDASTTVISPRLFNEFVAPYDAPIIEAAQQAGQRIVYHTCGGMMPILEDIAAMHPNAMETFTPRDMGADVDLEEAKHRIGDRVCMIGGFDQYHFFLGCTPAETRQAVRRAFEAAGEGGGFILSPSDHFFDAEVELIKTYADEAKLCTY